MVKAWKERVVIPTYEVGKPEKKSDILRETCISGKQRRGISLSGY